VLMFSVPFARAFSIGENFANCRLTLVVVTIILIVVYCRYNNINCRFRISYKLQLIKFLRPAANTCWFIHPFEFFKLRRLCHSTSQ